MDTRRIWFVAAFFVLIVAICFTVLWWPRKEPAVVTIPIKDFDDCMQKGYPILETFPRQCQGPDNTIYVEDFVMATTTIATSSNFERQ
jgi:hypothetical protein